MGALLLSLHCLCRGGTASVGALPLWGHCLCGGIAFLSKLPLSGGGTASVGALPLWGHCLCGDTASGGRGAQPLLGLTAKS